MAGLRDRTKHFALRIIRLVNSLPNNKVANIIQNQLLRSGTSVAANFREASRARTDAEFASKLGIVEQELDESVLWMELLIESGLVKTELLNPLIQEADELLRIVISAIKQTKNKRK